MFCEQYGCEEYIEIEPYTETVAVWTRRRRKLHAVTIAKEWVSLLMGVRFVPTSTKLLIYRPDETPFRSYDEILQSDVERERIARRFQRSTKRAEKQAEAERQRADAERQRADAAELENAQLLEKLRNMGIDPNSL